MNVVQNFQKYRDGYYCATELTEVLCNVIPGLKTPGIWFVRTLQNTTNLKNLGSHLGDFLPFCWGLLSYLNKGPLLRPPFFSEGRK